MTTPIASIADRDPETVITASGAQRTFDIDWPIRSGEHVTVSLSGASEDSDGLAYELQGVNDDAGFSIVFDTPPLVGTIITVRRETPFDRSTGFTGEQARQINAAAIDAEFNDQILRMQELRRDVRAKLSQPSTWSPGKYLRMTDVVGVLEGADAEAPAPDEDEPNNDVVLYPADIGLSTAAGFDNGPLLQTALDSLSAGGGGEFVSDGNAYEIYTTVAIPSFVTVRNLKAKLGPTASLSIAGRKKVAYSGIRLVSAAIATATTLVLDTAPLGGGPISSYAVVGQPFSISDGIAQESNTVTAIDDGTRTITVANALQNDYSVAGATVTLEVALRLASDSTLRSDQVTVDAADVALIAPGDWVIVEDDRRTGGATTWLEIRQVVGVEAAGDNIISLSGQLRRQYLTAQRARLTVMEPAIRAAAVGCSVECIGLASSTRFDPLFEIRYALDSAMVDCEYGGADTVGRRGNTFRIHKSYNCHFLDPSGRNPLFTEEGEGNICVIAYSTLCTMDRPFTQGARHAVQFIAATECSYEEVTATDCLLTAIDFHGMNSVGCFATQRTITFASRTASASNGVGAIGNATWLDGDHECLIVGGQIGPFQGNSGVYGYRIFPPSTYCYVKSVHGVRLQKFYIHRDIAGSGTLKTQHCGLIDCSVEGCGDRVIDLQGKASGASVNTLADFIISNFRGAGLYRGLLAYDVDDLVIEDSRLRFASPDASSERYALALKRIARLRAVDVKTYASDRGLDLEGCEDARFLACHILDLGDTEWLKDRGACDDTEFLGCNAYTLSGAAVTSDISGGSSILYKAVSNIGTETTTAYEFADPYKVLGVAGSAGPGQELSATAAGQSLLAAASGIAQVDLLFGVGSNIASASTTDLGTATEAAVTVTGTTTITSFGTVARGIRFVRFSGSLTLTHNGTSLILPGNANIQTEAGDTAFMYSLGSGNWVCMAYVRGDGSLATQRSNAVAITGGSIAGITDLAVADGGTGASTAVAALANLFTQGSDIASATTTDLATATGWLVDITGTTTITGLGTVAAGNLRLLRFNGALTFTHNGTSLILPGAANITTASGDIALMVSLGSGNWVCAFYRRADGASVIVQPVARGGTGAATKALARVALSGGATALSDAATIATDCSANDTFGVTLGGNRTLGNPTNVTAGTWYTWALKQDGTGSRTLALDTNFIQADGDSFAMKTAANSTTMLTAYAETTSRLLVRSAKYA